MSTLPEIEAAIEQLPEPLVEELARWIEKRRAEPTKLPDVEVWLQTAAGVALPGVTTDVVLAATRSEE
jgi:hypothetical protein